MNAPRHTHVMVDLETMGTAPGCVICSLGAVAYDPASGSLGPRFYAVIDQASCEAVGLTTDPATVEWWSKQSEEARAALKVDAQPLVHVLKMFSTWWAGGGGWEFWAHGPSFDESILAAAYRACGMAPPWLFWNARCTRTIYWLAGIGPDRTKGVHHNALTDAINQAEAVIKAYRRLGMGRRLWWRRLLRALGPGGRK